MLEHIKTTNHIECSKLASLITKQSGQLADTIALRDGLIGTCVEWDEYPNILVAKAATYHSGQVYSGDVVLSPDRAVAGLVLVCACRMGNLFAIVQKLEATDEIWPSSRRYAATGERCSLSLPNVRQANAWYTTDDGDYIVLY